MGRTRNHTDVEKMDSIINNPLLASAICESLTTALKYRPQIDLGGKTLWKIFKKSLDDAIYDIESHERGQLFQRLIEFGPCNPDDPETLISDKTTTLSDSESGLCVQFIYSHMVNRFKGELAEILALGPCIELVKSLKTKGHIPEETHLHWGNRIKERYKSRKIDREWGHFVKGADGLLAERTTSEATTEDMLKVHGIIEVKSYRGRKRILDQIEKHCDRLRGGLRLGTKEFSSVTLCLADKLHTI